MNTDGYTKAMLTIIAIALSIIALRMDFGDTAVADVAGMDSSDLRSDTDFKRAVRSIVEDCTVDGESISC